MSRKRARSPSPSSQITFTRSSSVEDRGSTFVGLYSATASPTALQSHPSIADATHRVLAWRIKSTQVSLVKGQHVYETGHDDDGEKHAGKKLESLLKEGAIEGAVVVARWYGGVMLGPIRFAHMDLVAREAIQKARTAGYHTENPAKMVKVDTNEKEIHRKLAETLELRDQNIAALRDMLEQKKGDLESVKDEIPSQKASTDEAPSQSSKPKKPPLDYSRMPLSTLRKLEAARDATIGWILKEIDKVEVAYAKTLAHPKTIRK